MRNLFVCLYIILFLNTASYAQKTVTAATGNSNSGFNSTVTNNVTHTIDTKNQTVNEGAGKVNLGVAWTVPTATLGSSTDANFFLNNI